MFLGYQLKKIGEEVKNSFDEDGNEVISIIDITEPFISYIAETREELENMPCVTFDKIEETDKTYFLHNGEYVCEISVETMQAEVRAVRNSYLEKYVDPKQLVLVWEGLSVDERNIYSDYRRYLLDYTDNEDWYLSNPMTLDEYLVANENTIDNTSEKGDNELLIV